MDYWSLVLLAVIHVIFDFVFQSREMARNKSSNFKYLAAHLFILAFGLMFYVKLSGRYTENQAIAFIYLNMIAHGLIDWNIWTLYKYTAIKRFPDLDKESFPYYDDSMFYNFIAFDQLLHGLCYLGFDYIVRYVL